MFHLRWNIPVTLTYVYNSRLAFLKPEAYKYESGIPNPDYTSTWVTLQSNAPGDTKRTFAHGLGEVPALVDVQVKAISGPNKDFVFTGVGK